MHNLIDGSISVQGNKRFILLALEVRDCEGYTASMAALRRARATPDAFEANR